MRTANFQFKIWVLGLFVIGLLTGSMGTVNGMLNALFILALGTLENWSTVKKSGANNIAKYWAKIVFVVVMAGYNVHLEFGESAVGFLIKHFYRI